MVRNVLHFVHLIVIRCLINSSICPKDLLLSSTENKVRVSQPFLAEAFELILSVNSSTVLLGLLVFHSFLWPSTVFKDMTEYQKVSFLRY